MSRESEKKDREEAIKKAKEANSKMNTDRLSLIENVADAAEMQMIREEEAAGIVRKPAEEDRKAAMEAYKQAEEKPPPEDEPVPEPSPEPEPQQAGDEKEVDGVKYYLTIVNGQEKWLTLKQLRETASKVEAADEYLRTAAEAARTAAAGAPSQKDEPPSLDEDQIADLYRKAALQDEDAIKALAKLTARPSVSKDVLQALDQRLSFRTELAALEAESQDLLKDPYMGRLFRARLDEMKHQAPNTALSEAYHSIDKELRGAFPGFKSSKLQEKLERKRTLPQVTSAGTRPKEEPEEEGEEDPAVVIERMAKARGISPHTYGPPRRQ